MSNDAQPVPRQYRGVMLSSTFTDLKEHRAALIQAIKGQGLTDVAMENDSAKPDVDVIESSLQMVRDASAYIVVIGQKYGQTRLPGSQSAPSFPSRNSSSMKPSDLKRPILLFIMGDDHLLRKADVETDADKTEKLNSFRERAKKMSRIRQCIASMPRSTVWKNSPEKPSMRSPDFAVTR